MKRINWKRLGAYALALFLSGTAVAFPVHGQGEPEREYIVKYRDDTARLMENDNVPFEVVSEREMKRLNQLGLLEWYEPDGEGILLDDTAGYYESSQWNLDVVQAGSAYARGCPGGGIRVGVIDSGVNPHKDLNGRILAGRNYMEGALNPDDTADEYGHGTKVAGLIAGAGEHGYIGTAPAAEIVPLKITDGKGVKVSAICRAIYGGVDEYQCNVLNLSLGVTGRYRSLEEAAAYAEKQNVVLVAAVGNAGGTTAYYPANYESVIGVGAVDRDGNISARSNHNKSVFLTAPGIDVRTTAAGGGYTLGTGTSFAVPQVTGAAAVLLGIAPSLSPAGIRELLAQSALDRGAEGYDEYYGYGILNLAGAIAALNRESMAEPCVFLPADGPAAQIRNNTDRTVRAVYFLVEYGENGRYMGMKAYPLEFPPHGAAEIESPAGTVRYGQFICDADSVIPLALARKSP